ncbi:MAG: CDP-alcohol phosphatidyltransferase family protein [Candidatus Thermoplasmatota archaeon]|nr:CDP-alcohol phosphatidyltransferase family protein [Candidatus Thermoplasmatota archaeon]MED6306296.1 CDP-alcohol phosphatidyltransferase family protein [Candidatus Thermoplasmatota archaeon]MEE3243014.1 CDP-alcohol phosphatidyltransferase family protein [Candidatus Thermoplasmatota archaeon]
MSLGKFFKPLTLLSYADIATLTSAFLGFLAITYIIDGSIPSFIVAMILLPISAIIDGMDGALARRFGTKHDFGKYLDSISDSICFGLAPSILVYSLYYDVGRGPALDFINNDLEFAFRYDLENLVAITAALMIALLSILRLARFTIGMQGENTYFSGLPAPGLTIFIVVISIKYSVVNDYHSILVPFVIGLVSLLTVTTIPYAKARAGFRNPILFGILVLIMTITLLYFQNSMWETLWYVSFSLYMVYFALIPCMIISGYFEGLSSSSVDNGE